jgi:flavin-dependent dehydrogenase
MIPSSLPRSLPLPPPQGLTTTVDDHLLIIGDAAGHIDPLTGEGIHTAMMGGKAAAQTLIDMVNTGDFTRQSCKAYERRWYQVGEKAWKLAP